VEQPPAPLPRKPVAGLDHAVIAVSDWAVSNAFYRDVVGAEVVTVDDGARFQYRFGDQGLNVHGPGAGGTPVARVPVAPGMADLCFVWTATLEEAITHLERHDVVVEEGPVPRRGARGEGESVYFRDPDGSLLEFIVYPA
jgi:catechol 2,3-dioxygenase-like lactoylglutathione lyase family enzyme